MSQKISRRNLLKTLGIGVAAAGAASLTGGSMLAQTTPRPGALNAVFTFGLGDWEMMVIKDANIAPPATVFGSNQSEEDVFALFDAANVLNDDNTVNALVDILVARSGDDIILFDVGFGSGGPGGNLVATLEAMGIMPGDVTTVVNSHWHGDHITGLATDGAPTFPNAMVMVSQTEYDFLQNAPADVVSGALSALQPALDADMVSFYNDEDEIISGIGAMAAPGHTPGHTAFLLESNGNRLLHLVDTTLNVYAHVPNPTWQSQFDADGDAAVETRIRLMGMATDEGIPVMGYHFPFPGIGYLSRDGEGFRFSPAAF